MQTFKYYDGYLLYYVVVVSELVTLRLPKEERKRIMELADVEDKDASTLMRELIRQGIKEKELAAALELYQKGRITAWKAAQLVGISLWEFTDLLRERKIPAQYGFADLKRDLEG